MVVLWVCCLIHKLTKILNKTEPQSYYLISFNIFVIFCNRKVKVRYARWSDLSTICPCCPAQKSGLLHLRIRPGLFKVERLRHVEVMGYEYIYFKGWRPEVDGDLCFTLQISFTESMHIPQINLNICLFSLNNWDFSSSPMCPILRWLLNLRKSVVPSNDTQSVNFFPLVSVSFLLIITVHVRN